VKIMRKKFMRKKFMLVAILSIICFGMTSIANASVTASEYISDYMAAINVSSSGKITVTFDINGTKTLDVVGVQTIIIQEKAPSSSTWRTFATLSSDDYPNMLSYNTNGNIGTVNYYGARSDCYYRAKVYFYAEKGGYDTAEYITAAA